MIIAGLFAGLVAFGKLVVGAALGQGPTKAFNLAKFIFRAVAVAGITSSIVRQRKRKSLKQENRNLTVRQAAGPRETIYGFIRKGGTIAYGQQHGDGNKFLSFVVLLCAHEVEDIKEVYFNSINLNLATTADDTDGIAQYVPATGNAYDGLVRVKKHLGLGDAKADADLKTDTADLAVDEKWTATDRLRGIAHLTIRIEQFHSVFQGQIPNVSAEIQGKNDIFDPAETKVTFTVDVANNEIDATGHGLSDGDQIRVQAATTLPTPLSADKNYFVNNSSANSFEIANERGGSPIDIEDTGSGTLEYIVLKWTANAALCAANYIEDKDLGWLEDWSETIDETVLNDSVTECDEVVDLTSNDTFTVDTVNDEFDSTSAHGLAIDDRVRVSTTGTLPTTSPQIAAGVAYFVVAVPATTSFQLATTLRGTVITISAGGSPTHTWTQVEPRYEAHGVLRADRSRENNLSDIVATMAGKWVDVHGNLFLHAGKYTAPTITLDEDDVRAPITIHTSRPKEQLHNAVKAIIISPNTDWQPGDAPTYNRRKTQTFGTADVNTGTDTITITAHGYLDGDPVEFSGTDLPAGIDTADIIYYVRDKATNTFKVALTPNGAVVDITDVGSGTHTAIHDPYLSADQGVRSYMDLQFDMVKSPYAAERIMKIALERNRRQLSIIIPCFLSAFQVQAGDTVSIDHTRMGWTGKVFEVLESPLVRDTADNGEPFYGVDIHAVETASAVYDWSTTDELDADLAANTNLPDIPTPTDVHFDLMQLFRNLAQTGGVLSWPFYDHAKDDNSLTPSLPENALHYRLSTARFEGIFRKPGHALDGYYRQRHAIYTDSANVTGDTTNDELDGTNSLIEDNELILTTTGTLPKPLIPYLKYWIINRAAATVQISRERGGSVVDIINTGSGTHTYWSQYSARVAREGTHGRGILIEEARKSFLRQSNRFNHADWTLTKLTAEAGLGDHPISFLDLTEDGTTGNHQIAQDARATMSSSFTAVASIWVRPDNRTKFKIFITRKDGSNKGAAFTLTGDGTVASQNSATSASIRKISHAGSNDYRLALSCRIGTGGTTPRATFRVLDDSGNDSFAGNSLRACEAVDFQMEETTHGGETNAKNPPVGSLLRTTTTLFNRSADVLYARTLNPWFNFVEGTVYIEFTIDYVAIDDNVEYRPEQVLWNFSDDTADERLYAYIWEEKIRYQSIRSGSQDFEISETISPGTHKLAVTYKQGGPFRFLLDNGDFQEQATGNMPESITAFNTGCSQVPDSQLNGFVAHILVLPWRAKDQMMRRMTEPDS